MKALIRNEGETVCESDGIEGIDWKTGAPLTCPDWAGGPYRMIDNYDTRMDEEIIVRTEQPKTEEEIVENDDYVIIEGKKYSKQELRSLLK